MIDSLSTLRTAIRDVPDFPKPGILFKDITPILASGELFREAVNCFVQANAGVKIDKIVGIDARGFLFGAAAAYQLKVGFVPVRKKGKLPFNTESVCYALEYGESEVEMHVDAITPGERVVLIDDLLATGGTAAAATRLISKMGGELIEAQFLIELEFLKGRQVLGEVPIRTFLKF
ncbi:MAG: adenine phosphoribosyltransferase [Verrucomicrobiota bacterium]